MANGYDPAKSYLDTWGAPKGGDGMNPMAIQAGSDIFSPLMSLFASGKQADATRDSALIAADAMREAGIRTERLTEEQQRFIAWQLEREYKQWQDTQQGNWDMERARELRSFAETGDEWANLFGLQGQERKMAHEETAADRFNVRQMDVADIKREYGRFGAQQRRVGDLAARMGTRQPRGGREIPGIELPGALQQPDFVEMPDPQQTAFNYPKYRTPQQWEGYQSSADAAQEARTNETARAAAASGMTVADYMRQQRWDRRADERERRT